MKRILAAASAAILLTVAAPGGAEAAKPPKRLLATPSNVCQAFVAYGAASSFGGCVSSLKANINAFRFPSDDDPNVLIGLYERCAAFEASGEISYPFTFVEGPDWPLPVYTAQNRQQCAATLYAYHELIGVVAGGPPA